MDHVPGEQFGHYRKNTCLYILEKIKPKHVLTTYPFSCNSYQNTGSHNEQLLLYIGEMFNQLEFSFQKNVFNTRYVLKESMYTV